MLSNLDLIYPEGNKEPLKGFTQSSDRSNFCIRKITVLAI